MKVFTTALIVACLCLSLTSILGVSIIGDVLIQTLQNGSLSCDSLICPEGATQCRVTKRNDPNDLNIIIRHRQCLTSKGDVLAKEKINEKSKFPGIVNIDIISSGGSLKQLTPEEQKELEEYLAKTEEQVNKQVTETIKRVYTSLGSLLDGTFFKSSLNSTGSLFDLF